MKDHQKPDSEDHQPWWAPDAPVDRPLPEGFPQRPDGKKVEELRKKLQADKQARTSPEDKPRVAKYAGKMGKQVRDIGAYTLIPSMMIAGPAVGYGLGWLFEKQWGGAPWGSVVGLLFGLVAAFRQIFIILARKAASDGPRESLKTERKQAKGPDSD